MLEKKTKLTINGHEVLLIAIAINLILFRNVLPKSFLYTLFALIMIGIFFKPLTFQLGRIWMHGATLLSDFFGKIVLSFFYLSLFSLMGMIYRLKSNPESFNGWKEVKSKTNFKTPW